LTPTATLNDTGLNQTDTPTNTNVNNISDGSINSSSANSSTTVLPSTPSNTSNTNATPNKIEILLKAVGNAPILKNRKFQLERTKNVHFIIGWLKKYMKLDPKDQLFLYVNQEFAPSPDTDIGTIYDCFKIGNTVIFHYCTTPAWG
jgi:ubiquitin-like protein ATG12